MFRSMLAWSLNEHRAPICWGSSHLPCKPSGFLGPRLSHRGNNRVIFGLYRDMEKNKEATIVYWGHVRLRSSSATCQMESPNGHQTISEALWSDRTRSCNHARDCAIHQHGERCGAFVWRFALQRAPGSSVHSFTGHSQTELAEPRAARDKLFDGNSLEDVDTQSWDIACLLWGVNVVTKFSRPSRQASMVGAQGV